MSEILTDWTKPEAYFRLRSLPLRHRFAAALLRLHANRRAASIERTQLRAICALRAATRELPPYLRRDIGLPPYC